MVQQYPVRKATAEVLTADISSPMTPKFPVDVPSYTGPIPPSEYMQGGPGDNRYNIDLYNFSCFACNAAKEIEILLRFS